MQYLWLMILILLVGCNSKNVSSVSEEEIKEYQTSSTQLLQDVNAKISIRTIPGFTIIDTPATDNLILSAFNNEQDISLSAFDFGKINITDYFTKLKNKLASQKINFIEKNNTIIYRLQYIDNDKTVQEVCLNYVVSQNNYVVCVNSKLSSFDELENSVQDIQFTNLKK